MTQLWGEDFKIFVKENWTRFLDDCFTIWNYSNGHLTDFYEILNTLDPDIKFTIETSSEEIPFPDIRVKKQMDTITTDI